MVPSVLLTQVVDNVAAGRVSGPDPQQKGQPRKSREEQQAGQSSGFAFWFGRTDRRLSVDGRRSHLLFTKAIRFMTSLLMLQKW